MTNQYLHDRADGHTAEFYRGAWVQSLEGCIEVKDVFVLRMKKTARAEEEQSGNRQRQTHDEEETDRSGICFLAHKEAGLDGSGARRSRRFTARRFESTEYKMEAPLSKDVKRARTPRSLCIGRVVFLMMGHERVWTPRKTHRG